MRSAILLTACAVVAGGRNHAAVKVRTQFTKSFDFAKAKTWSCMTRCRRGQDG
jgi:hypothetical protein